MVLLHDILVKRLGRGDAEVRLPQENSLWKDEIKRLQSRISNKGFRTQKEDSGLSGFIMAFRGDWRHGQPGITGFKAFALQ
jgi:hypothetical protein